MSGKTHIDRLHEERVNNTLWCRSQANVANFADGCLNGRFFNELLQNTDDAGGGLLECTLKDRTLTICHSGRHFIESDVDKIVDFADQVIRDKSANTAMTGYKGIGFKALLAIATKVHIFSGGYSFRFDKDHWKKHPHPMPWQMIPIWTEPPSMSGEKVTFIFDLIDPKTIEQQLREFGKEPRPMLFLRNIKVIRFSLNQQQKVIQREDIDIRRKLKEDRILQSEWIIKTIAVEIPDDVQDSVQNMNTTLCPDRLKTAKTIELSFGFLTINQLLVDPSKAPKMELFTTLPTKVRLGLPFTVNTEFLLEAQREHLVESRWNTHLFECMAHFHFAFLGEFAQGGQWENILHAVGPRTIMGVEKGLADAYRKGFKSGYETFAWIPSYPNPRVLLKLEECCIDGTGFYLAFKDDAYPGLMPKNLAHFSLRNVEKLKDLIYGIAPKNYLSESHVLNHLVSLFQRNPDPAFCYRVLVFFMNSPGKWNAFKESAWIPTEQGGVGKLSFLFFPQKENCPSPPSFIEISVMHPEIFSRDEKNELRRWLTQLGVQALSAKNIVGSIELFVNQKKVTVENSFALVRYLFTLYSENLISKADLQKLDAMPILSSSGKLTPLKQLYLSKDYHPGQNPDLQALLPNRPDLFVHPGYIEDPNTVNAWWDFFLTLGVQERCELCLLERTSVAELQTQNIFRLTNFLNYLYGGSTPVIGRGFMSKDLYRNFLFFPMMENLVLKEFAEQFWTSLNSWGNRFLQVDSTCQFVDGRNTARPLATYEKCSYIKYILTHFPSIPGTDGKLHCAQELYSPAFRDLRIEGIVSANIAIPLSEELVEYLGFKVKIPFSECHTLLTKMRSEKINHLPLYSALLQNLIAGWEDLTKKDQREALKKEWYFLACNNEWKKVETLYVFDVKGATPTLTSNRWFKKAIDRMDKLAAIFNCQIVRGIVREDQIQNPIEDGQVRDSLLNILPLIAWIRAHALMQPVDDVLRDLAAQLKNLHIFQAESIPAVEEGTQPLDLALLGNRLYYTEGYRKQRLAENLGEYFGFDDQALRDFKEILSLKPARSTRYRKSIDDWMAEKGISSQEMKRLQELLSSCDNTPNLEPIVIPSSPAMIFDYHEAGQSQDIEDSSIDNSSITEHPSPSQNDPLADLFAGLGFNEVSPITKPAPSVSTEGLSFVRKRLSFDGEASPTIPLEQIPLPQRGIEELKIKKKRPNIEPGVSGSGTKKSVKNKNRLSDEEKSFIGRWGELFSLKGLIDKYQKKYGQPMNEVSPGRYRLVAEGVVEIGLTWLNHQEESFKPFDLELTKKKEGQPSYTRPVEVKATQEGKVHFFLSENEWEILHKEPKYRLYLVINAGKKEATMHKIKKPLAWIQGEDVTVKEHKKYEVTAAIDS